MGISYEELTEKHPCFARGEKGRTGRIHLPVSPGCNISCKFCDRKLNGYENRPGVTSSIISPEEAVSVIRESLKLCKVITVAGIAGPGDTLATPYALETFRLVKKEFPDLIKCMSTNGLLLDEKAEEVADVGVDSLTVTVNAVDPAVQAKIISGIHYEGKNYIGEKAAEILIENQLKGIRKISQKGISIKVNTVLIPGINDKHIGETAKAVKAAGARMYNIIPLIPQHQLAHCQAPGCEQVDQARREAEQYIDVFRHCQRCRADAIGIPGGRDYGEKIYLNRMRQKDTFSHG